MSDLRRERDKVEESMETVKKRQKLEKDRKSGIRTQIREQAAHCHSLRLLLEGLRKQRDARQAEEHRRKLEEERVKSQVRQKN